MKRPDRIANSLDENKNSEDMFHGHETLWHLKLNDIKNDLYINVKKDL